MITGLQYFNGINNYDCSLKKHIGDKALILLKIKNVQHKKIIVKFDSISVSSKYKIHK